MIANGAGALQTPARGRSRSRGVGAGVGIGGRAADPSGGMSVFQALEKQLGLKAEKGTHPFPVTVIDHVEQKPTD